MIEFAFIIACVTLFLHACTWEGNILGKVPEWLWNAPVWLKKPLYSCPVCMAPWWGSLIIAAFGLVTDYWPHWFVWIMQLLIAGGMNVIFTSLIKPDEDAEILADEGSLSLLVSDEGNRTEKQ